MTANQFNNDPVIIKSFRESVAVLLSVEANDVINIVAASMHRRLSEKLISRILATSSCSISYDVKVNSEKEMKEMSAKMTSKFSNSASFTSEMQKIMKANSVTSVAPSSVTADTTAVPQNAGRETTPSSGASINPNSNDADTTNNNDPNTSSEWVDVIIPVVLLVFIAVVVLVVWYQYKVIDVKTDNYESFVTFYKRVLCCNSTTDGENIEMTNPLSSYGVDSGFISRHEQRLSWTQQQQDPLTLAQWTIPPSKLHLGERIGAGGCGWIYKGTLGSGTSVKIACKEVISATINPEDLQEFQHEARMLAQLNHPFLIKFYGVCTKTINNEQTMGKDEQRMYMVTELASGGSLEEQIEQGNHMQRLMKTKAATPDMKMPFDGIQTTCWALQIAAGVSCYFLLPFFLKFFFLIILFSDHSFF